MASQSICSIPGCGNSGKITRGLCDKHYQRLRKNGDPLKSKINRDQTGKPCKVDGCCKPSGFKGYCSLHGDRFNRTGDPLVASLSPNYRSHHRWLADHRDYKGDDCLIWPFHRNSNGRGVALGTSAPHAMCTLAHGKAPTSAHEAAHKCGRGHLGCINPRHLRWATRTENEADKIVHGTLRRGTQINTNKLTEDDVFAIRKSVETGVVLADRYGVTPAAISSIKSRKSWAWLK